MKTGKYNVITLITVIIFALCITGCGLVNCTGRTSPFNKVISSIENYNKSPNSVFAEAWKDIKNEYLDKTCNHQDWNRWKTRYINKLETNEDAYVAIDTMVESLNDPYTRFLTPSDFQEQDRSIDATLYGIGVHIAQRKDDTLVIHIIENTPAQKAGLKIGDVILKVNQTSAKGLDLKKVADLVRGKAGTKVQLTILRNKKILTLYVPREKINVKTVKTKIINKNIAYIHISSFISNDTSKEVAQTLKKNQNVKGIILDLRGNFGGLLPNAIYISNMFIKKGIIVSIVDRTGYKENINAEPAEIITNKPLVVLINGASASASEILCGALKDHKRAVVVGETTFGKGLVQKITRLPDGSGLNITIAKYLTPNGNDIDKKGIKPDYQVEYTEKDFLNGHDPQLKKAEQIIQSKIKQKSIASR